MSRDSTTQTTEGRENDPPWSFEELVRVTLDVLDRAMGLIRSELRGRRNDKAAKARRAVGRLTELDSEELAGGLRKIGRGGRNVYLVELLRQASWRTADPALARARAKAAAAVLREVIPPRDQMALRELLDTLSVACLVALARGHRRDGGIRRGRVRFLGLSVATAEGAGGRLAAEIHGIFHEVDGLQLILGERLMRILAEGLDKERLTGLAREILEESPPSPC